MSASIATALEVIRAAEIIPAFLCTGTEEASSDGWTGTTLPDCEGLIQNTLQVDSCSIKPSDCNN